MRSAATRVDLGRPAAAWLSWRRLPLVNVTVDLYGGSAATVRFRPTERRWPDHETQDRLDLAVGFAARSLLEAEPPLIPRIRHRAMGIASSLVDDLPEPGHGSWTENVAGRLLVTSDRPGAPRIEARLVATRSGSRVEVLDAPPTSLALSAASAAVAAAALRDTSPDVHLAAALAMEGLLLWCGMRESARSGPERALGECYAYALRRFADADRPVPDALRSAALSSPAGRTR